MTEQQICKLAAVLVEFQNCFSVLSNEEAQWVIQNTEKAIQLMTQAIKDFKKSQEKILELEMVEPKIIIPATTEKFVADKFIVDTSKKSKVKISYLGYNFRERFLDKIEEPAKEIILSSRKLLKYLLDSEIISDLGGEEKVEVKLSHIFYLMSQQPNGEAGMLSTVEWNIFYSLDKAGLLCTVRAGWGGDGWGSNAYSVDDPDRWYDGYYVFSPQILET